MDPVTSLCSKCRGQLFQTFPHKCVPQLEMDASRFRELVKRKDTAKKKFDEARAAMDSAKEAYDSAAHHFSEAANNLQDYVQDCAGDPGLGSYRR
jgi:hypothetical protein